MKKKQVKGKPVPDPNKEILALFTANLKKEVEATGKTPYALALSIGLDKDIIKTAISGNREPKLSTVLRIAKGMKISVDALIGIQDCAHSESASEKEPLKVEIKKDRSDFINHVMEMHDADADLLKGIAVLLNDRRKQSVVRLIKAVKGDGFDTENKFVKPVSLPDDDDFDFDDDFEDDNFDEDDEDFGDDDDDLYEDDDDFDGDDD